MCVCVCVYWIFFSLFLCTMHKCYKKCIVLEFCRTRTHIDTLEVMRDCANDNIFHCFFSLLFVLNLNGLVLYRNWYCSSRSSIYWSFEWSITMQLILNSTCSPLESIECTFIFYSKSNHWVLQFFHIFLVRFLEIIDKFPRNASKTSFYWHLLECIELWMHNYLSIKNNIRFLKFSFDLLMPLIKCIPTNGREKKMVIKAQNERSWENVDGSFFFSVRLAKWIIMKTVKRRFEIDNTIGLLFTNFLFIALRFVQLNHIVLLHYCIPLGLFLLMGNFSPAFGAFIGIYIWRSPNYSSE